MGSRTAGEGPRSGADRRSSPPLPAPPVVLRLGGEVDGDARPREPRAERARREGGGHARAGGEPMTESVPAVRPWNAPATKTSRPVARRASLSPAPTASAPLRVITATWSGAPARRERFPKRSCASRRMGMASRQVAD